MIHSHASASLLARAERSDAAHQHDSAPKPRQLLCHGPLDFASWAPAHDWSMTNMNKSSKTINIHDSMLSLTLYSSFLRILSNERVLLAIQRQPRDGETAKRFLKHITRSYADAAASTGDLGGSRQGAEER
ncbi:hypothetical protein XA68_16785 [Ophiocordyceps unilateralis]|uniref:Uncharacterized protein n=1 Tax=Ophiocordyceps unilateralis TaxID=268505 RepID=A0A2A9P5Q0_OPHUN|nr:hypothetical protein XA68_16785 [Ophiocordyceps unilateralis]